MKGKNIAYFSYKTANNIITEKVDKKCKYKYTFILLHTKLHTYLMQQRLNCIFFKFDISISFSF